MEFCPWLLITPAPAGPQADHRVIKRKSSLSLSTLLDKLLRFARVASTFFVATTELV